MQIIFRFYHFLIVCSVLGLHKGFLKFVFGVLVLMDIVKFLRHLIMDYELGRGLFMFGLFEQVSKFLGLFLLFGFGMRFLRSVNINSGVIRVLRELRVKPGGGEKNGILKILPLVDETKNENSNSDAEFVEKVDTGSDDEFDDNFFEFNVSKLRRMLRIERRRANVAVTELAKERAASASASEEAMAMILRLQNEKSLIELESSQYRRLAEEKQIHDQEVIRSLQWLVWRHESERGLLEDRLRLCRRKWKRCSCYRTSDEREQDNDDDDEGDSSFNGNIVDALENVLYSSRDDTNFLS